MGIFADEIKTKYYDFFTKPTNATAPYTKEELLEMAEKGRKQIAAGQYYTTEEVILHCLSNKSYHKSV